MLRTRMFVTLYIHVPLCEIAIAETNETTDGTL